MIGMNTPGGLSVTPGSLGEALHVTVLKPLLKVKPLKPLLFSRCSWDLGGIF